MSVVKDSTITTLPKAFCGWKPREPGNHVIALVPGDPGAGPNVCMLCSNEVPEATAHLEMCCYAEMREGELGEGMRICASCASMDEMAWKKALRDYMIERLAHIIADIPASAQTTDDWADRPGERNEFYLGMDEVAGNLLCLKQIADMCSKGIDIQPEALDFIKHHYKQGGAV